MENQNIDKIEEILFRYYQGKVTNEEYQLIVAWSESSEENKKLIQQLYSIYLATDIRKVTKQVDTEKALHKVSNQIAIRKKHWLEVDTTCCRDIIYSSIGDNRTIIAKQ